MDADSPEAIARHRWQVLVMVRLGAMGLVVIGALIWLTPALGVQSDPIGRVTLVAGLLMLIVLPRVLRRRWRIGS